LIAEAGYNGEKIVILDAVDLLTNHIHALVTFDPDLEHIAQFGVIAKN
jgi:REP element-mobilizing transposase RayT